MIRSLCKDIDVNLYNNMYNTEMHFLSKSNDYIDFQKNFKVCAAFDYDTIVINLDKIRSLKPFEKFYFNGNNEFHIHTNYIGVWGISFYRQIAGYNRLDSFNDLGYFLRKVALFIRRCFRNSINTWNLIPNTKVKILIHKFTLINKGLNNLKVTYKEDTSIINHIKDIIKEIDEIRNIKLQFW